MKISVSLPPDDLAFVDEYAARTGDGSRSSAIHQAIGLLRMYELEESYAETWREWDASGDAGGDRRQSPTGSAMRTGEVGPVRAATHGSTRRRRRRRRVERAVVAVYLQ